MSLFLALSITILITNLVLGLFVFFKNRKNRAHRLYLCFTISTAIWILGIILIAPPFGKKLEYLLPILEKIPFLGASFVAISLFYFFRFFPRKILSPHKIITRLWFFLMTAMVLMSLLYRLAPLKILDTYKYQMDFHQLYPYWVTSFLFFIASGLGIIIWKYKRTTGIEKLQIKYFLIGICTSTVSAIFTNLIIPSVFPSQVIGFSPIWQFGPLALFPGLVLIGRAILKYQLLNIKVITTELLVGLMVVMLLMDLLLAKSVSAGLVKLGILVTFSYLGMSLIRSVLQEIKRREEIEKMSFKLQRAYQELKKLDEAKSEFIAMASHQLRTPLSIVKGFVSMLLEGGYGKAPVKFNRPLNNVFESNERLIKIVNNLLDISKIDLGKTEISKEKVQIEDLIGQVIKEFKGEAKKRNLYIKWKKPIPVLPKIEINTLRIRQAILCVIDNAIKYTEKGGITVQVQNPKSKIQIIISDTGVGMTKTEIKRAFESFTRGAAGLKLWVQGTGLGLYLTKRYVDLHNGKIWIKSAGAGKGTSFYIELPLK